MAPTGAPRAAADAAGRQAGALFTIVGLLGLLTDFLPGTIDQGHLLPIVLDAANVEIGLVAWLVPWSRLPRHARLVLPLLAFASVAANGAAGVLPMATIGVWYVLVFVWIGLWTTPTTALAFAPVAAASYLLPFALGAPQSGGVVTAVVLVIPVAVVVGTSIARKTTADLARRTAEERLATILDSAPIALFACDAEGKITFNQGSALLMGAPSFLAGGPQQLGAGRLAEEGAPSLAPDDTIGRSMYEVLRDDPGRLERLRRALRGDEFTAEVEVMGRFLDVRYKPVYNAAGAIAGVSSVAFDVTERVKAQRERRRLEVQALADSRRQAYTDDLTGLANRRSLYEHLDGLMGEVHGDVGFAFLLLDLDRFKEVNDALGHTAGDRLLDQVGPRLASALGGGGLISRLGGDEFALVLPGGSGAEEGMAVAERVIASFGFPFDLGDVSIHTNVSIGIALYPVHAASRSELMRCADVAMYRAKRSRRGVAVYDRGSDGNDRKRLVTIEQLRSALGDGQMVCHFQPKLAVHSGRVLGAEALVRWEHPTRGLLAPAEFVGLAEQTGLISQLSRVVLDLALGECRRWHDDGHAISVAVNLAVSDLLDTTLPATVAALLVAHGLHPQALVLEITENAIMVDPERVGLVVAQLQAFGVGLSVDDYGTGYSSLSYLRDLPIHELKLDRSFVTDISTSPKDQAIVKATVSLARSLGLRLVAEGVETRSDWEYLRRLEVEVAQGYALSRPLCPEHFAAWLSEWSGPTADDLPAMTELFGAAEQAENCSRHGATSGPEPTSDVALEGVS